MQGQKIIKKTIITLFKTMLYICLFIVAGAISYKVTRYFDTKSEGSSSGTKVEHIVEAKTDAIAQNLVLGIDEDTAEIQSIVLEIFNSNTENIDLITIPATTKVTMSQDLYSKLLDVNANVPQSITLGNIGKYFDQSVAYEYATLILNEYLNTTISFYSAMLTEDFDNYFTNKENSDGRYTFTDDMLQKLEDASTEQDILELLISYYEDVQSNLLLSERRAYLSSYLTANYAHIHTYLLTESYVDGQYVLSDEDRSLITTITEYATAYTDDNCIVTGTEQGQSLGRTIQILNGTSTAGLAASYQTQLETDGYTISEIGNYTGMAQETTRIIVIDESLGADLAEYFDNPSIEVGTVDGGYDILIILGSKDA